MERDAISGEIPKICCLCGDIGFSESLLGCPLCGYRLQHTYCSRYYPDKIDIENWGCEWCIHKRQQEGPNQEEKEERKKKVLKGSGAGAQNQNVKRNMKAVDRWRKLFRAAKMIGSGRRYKLLADVLRS